MHQKKVKQKHTNLCSNETTESKRGKMTIVDTILIQMANVHLNRGMVLCSYESVSGRAETWFGIGSNFTKEQPNKPIITETKLVYTIS